MLPAIVDTAYFLRTRTRINMTDPGPWLLTGSDTGTGRDITTTHDGPLGAAARRALAAAYPGVQAWDAEPAVIDETYRDMDFATRRLAELLDIDPRTARAVLSVAAEERFRFRFAAGPWEVTGDEDDQSWRIRSIPARETVTVTVSSSDAQAAARVLYDWDHDGAVTLACWTLAEALTQAQPAETDGQEAVVRASFARLDPPLTHVPMACNGCDEQAVPAPGTGDPARGWAGQKWMHAADSTESCHGKQITVRVDA